jgi:hypothetical protein
MWNLFLVDKLMSIGFTTLLIDYCIFLHGGVIFMVYVDDGIFLGSNNLQLQEIIKVRCTPKCIKKNAVNLILRLFLYHFLHTMSS